MFNPKLTDRQTQAYLTINRPDVVDLLYGGAKGGAKSTFLVLWVYMWSVAIAERFKMKCSEHPLHIGWIGRKQATDFTGTTLQSWYKMIPSEEYQIRSGSEKDPKHILIQGRIAVDFGGLDKQENINKFNSAEYAFVAVDQAEETSKDDVSVLCASRRLTIGGKKLNYKGLWTANPAQCWLKEEFISKLLPGNAFIQALPSDNPYLPQDYTETLTKAFRHRPELLGAYLRGDWNTFDTSNQVIKSAWLQTCRDVILYKPEIKRIVSCDPARYGQDETVIYVLENGEIIDEVIYGQRDTHFTSGEIFKKQKEYGCAAIVDGDGIGGGIIDNLIAYGSDVIEYRGSSAALNNERYYNRRAEAWDYAAQQFNDAAIRYNSNDNQLENELLAVTYSYSNGKMLLVQKDDKELQKKLGRSPDRADAYVMGLWGLQFVNELKEDNKTNEPSLKDLIATNIAMVAI